MTLKSTPDSDEHPILQSISERAPALRNPGDVSLEPPSQDNDSTIAFRPFRRQPAARLTILDDGCSHDGEVIRLRDSVVKIGRDTDDISIPFDTDMSGCHAELQCRRKLGDYRWFLVDVGSTNGTFLRAYRATLREGAELMLGSRRYIFQGPEGDRVAAPDETITYKPLSAATLDGLRVRLVEVGGTSSVSLPIHEADALLGRSAACSVAIVDPLLSSQHARFYKDKRRRWTIEDCKSRNGVWIRVKRVALDHQAEFQLGQQRFLFEQR